jgi:hypothetical protein
MVYPLPVTSISQIHSNLEELIEENEVFVSLTASVEVGDPMDPVNIILCLRHIQVGCDAGRE